MPAFNKHGFTLVEMAVGVAILGIVGLAGVAAFNYSMGSQTNVQSVSDFNSLFTETQMVLDDVKSCTMNLQGMTVPTSGNQDITLYSMSTSGGKGDVLITKNKAYSNMITVNSVTLSMKSQLTSDRSIAQVTIQATKNGSSLGPKQISQSFPVLAFTDAFGKVISCYGNYSNGGLVTLQEQICNLTSGGDLYFDPISGTCKNRYVTQCYPGTQTSATCAAGPALVSLAKPSCTANITQTDTRILTRTYAGGVTDTVKAPPPMLCSATGTFSVNCLYAIDATVDSSTVCSACCKLDVTKMPGTPSLAGP